jgi:3',5'-nucleoside bisphosphate phosphatase
MRHADLHIHTNASDDATQTIEWVFARAAELGLTAITISDHEGMVQWDAGRRLAREHGLIFVPGIEISSTWNGLTAHMLGLFPRGAGASLESFLVERVWAERRRVQTAILERLQSQGAALTLDEYEQEIARNRPGTFHMPLYRLLRRKAILADEQEYMALRKATIEGFGYPTAQETIAAIHDAGGAAVLAHPGGSDPGFHQFTGEEIAALAAAGLDGVEVFHRKHDEALTRRYAKAAERLGLPRFGGSDSHRADAAPGRRVGDHTCDWDEVRSVLDGA